MRGGRLLTHSPRCNYQCYARTAVKGVSGPNPHGIHLDKMRLFPKYRDTATAIYGVLEQVRSAGRPSYTRKRRLRTFIPIVQSFFALPTPQFLDGGHHVNELYVARYIPYFQTQIGYPELEVTGMLLELVKDNSKILDRLGAKEFAVFVYWLRQKMSPPFLEFLQALCTCEGKEIAENQDCVVTLLWEQHDQQQLLYLLRCGDGVLEVKKSASEPWMPVKALNPKKGGDVWLCSQRFLARFVG